MKHLVVLHYMSETIRSVCWSKGKVLMNFRLDLGNYKRQRSGLTGKLDGNFQQNWTYIVGGNSEPYFCKYVESTTIKDRLVNPNVKVWRTSQQIQVLVDTKIS